MTQITMIVPAAHRADATALVMTMGASAADWQGAFANLGWQASDGAQFALACWDARDGWLADAQATPVRPDWDGEPFAVNLAGAVRARALLEVHEPGEGVSVSQASGETILVLVGNPEALVAAARLVRIVEGDT